MVAPIASALTKSPLEVARRCLCLELLLQRLGLEASEDALVERERVRAAWLGRLSDLGVSSVLSPEELALLERPVGQLGEDDLDDLDERASGALVLLWALGYLVERPTLASYTDMAELIDRFGLLGTGSVSTARSRSEAATLRARNELESALSSYSARRGKARSVADPDKAFAGVCARHLEWVVDPNMNFEDALSLA